jgi:hypothetical protein
MTLVERTFHAVPSRGDKRKIAATAVMTDEKKDPDDVEKVFYNSGLSH